MTSLDSNFLCGCSHGADSSHPVRMRPPEPNALHVDLINRWPLILLLYGKSGMVV